MTFPGSLANLWPVWVNMPIVDYFDRGTYVIRFGFGACVWNGSSTLSATVAVAHGFGNYPDGTERRPQAYTVIQADQNTPAPAHVARFAVNAIDNVSLHVYGELPDVETVSIGFAWLAIG